jgi:hypothetical protein
VVFFVLAYTVVATAVVLDNWKAAVTGVVLLVLFVGVYFVGQQSQQHPGDKLEY